MLWARAFPPGGVRGWRRRIRITALLTFGLFAARQTFPMVLVLASGVPTLVRYLRREVALGLLLRDGRRYDEQLARIPAADLRSLRHLR